MPTRPKEIRLLQIIAFFSIALWGVVQAKPFLVPLCYAALLAFLMTPGVRFLKRHRVPEVLALLLSGCILILPLASIAYVALDQTEALVQAFPAIQSYLKQEMSLIFSSTWLRQFHLGNQFTFLSITSKLGPEAGPTPSMGIAFSSVKAILSAGEEVVLVVIFALLMLGSRERLKRFIEQIIVRNGIAAFLAHPGLIIETVAELIQRFLAIRLLIVLIVGGIDTIILKWFGIPYSLLIGVFIGLMTLIPIFGFVLSAVPPMILAAALGFSFFDFIGLLVALTVVSAVEANILSPKLLGRHLNLNLLVTFLGLFAGGLLWGTAGMFLSIPLLGVLRVILSSVPQVKQWGELMAEKENCESRESIAGVGRTLDVPRLFSSGT